MSDTLLRGWTTARLIRLLLAVVFLIAGLDRGDLPAYAASGILGVQALFNIGCCGTACNAVRSSDPVADVAVEYDEIR